MSTKERKLEAYIKDIEARIIERDNIEAQIEEMYQDAVKDGINRDALEALLDARAAEREARNVIFDTCAST